jgi:hypothetical protein
MYERAGTGTTANGDRPVGGGMYEKAGTGDGNRPVGGGMYEKAGTSTAPVRLGKSVGILIGKPVVVAAKTPAITPVVRPTVVTVTTPTITPVVRTTVGAVRITTAPTITPVIRVPTVPVFRR